MSKHVEPVNRRTKYVHFGLFLIIGLDILLLIAFVFQGKNFAVLNPKGFIAGEQAALIILSTVILLAIAIPTLALLYFFAWKYRETDSDTTLKAAHEAPTSQSSHVSSHGKLFTFSIWAIPSFFMLILALVMIPATHRLDPRQQISSDKKPLTIQVVAMRWKWVFIYPEQNIATVNYVQIPTGTPIKFELSADESPMSSFWIPNLGGQLYAMTGHVNTLNLMADKPGDYPGSSAELTGEGFAGMKFVARASSSEKFEQWVTGVKASSDVLDSTEYTNLLEPSENNKAAFYSRTEAQLFSTMLLKYTGSHDGSHGDSHNQTVKE